MINISDIHPSANKSLSVHSFCVLEEEFKLVCFLAFNFSIVSESTVNTKQKGTVYNVQQVL